MAVDPFSRFVFVANSASGTVSAYNIGANGALTLVAGFAFSRGKRSRFSRGGPVRPVRLRGKHLQLQHLCLSHRCQRGPGARRRVAFRYWDQSLLPGGGPVGPVCLRCKLGQRHRVGVPHRCQWGPDGRSWVAIHGTRTRFSGVVPLGSVRLEGVSPTRSGPEFLSDTWARHPRV